MSAYWIAHVTVLDPEKCSGYTAVAPIAFEKFGALFLARGGKFHPLEVSDSSVTSSFSSRICSQPRTATIRRSTSPPN